MAVRLFHRDTLTHTHTPIQRLVDQGVLVQYLDQTLRRQRPDFGLFPNPLVRTHQENQHIKADQPELNASAQLLIRLLVALPCALISITHAPVVDELLRSAESFETVLHGCDCFDGQWHA